MMVLKDINPAPKAEFIMIPWLYNTTAARGSATTLYPVAHITIYLIKGSKTKHFSGQEKTTYRYQFYLSVVLIRLN
jgi:hypothetical protein